MMKCLLSILLFTVCGFCRAQYPAPANYTFIKDQVYKTVDDWNGQMDIYVPKDSKRKTPLLIFIHGGGWTQGSKNAEYAFSFFFEKNFAVANIDYRLAGKAVAPAAIEDCYCALSYLVENAEKLNIDPKKIVIMGISAGGHLALMTGLKSANAHFKSTCGIKKNYRVAAIIDYSGPTDLNRWETIRKPNKASSSWFGGRHNDTTFVNRLSPISYLGKASPPILIVHGAKDQTVPYAQSVTLFNRLKALGSLVVFKSLEGLGHTFSAEKKKELHPYLWDFLQQAGIY